ncbi:MAG: uncharacterized protein KVP18_001417 [Porospora cf. gigantea A]|uniref:uncharacterized protein n=1 Tax=Porospora cf. gigantea A TaxID=2853593 RepID=UPI00355962DD|nr:MAG: hypothetical protein KVP18_001417 [Porospora cf. gigantea A]
METSAYSQTTVNGEVVERVQTRNGLPVGPQVGVASTLRGATPFMTGGDYSTIATTEFPAPFVTGIDFPTGIPPFPLHHQIHVGSTVPAHAESTTTTTSHRFVNNEGETEERFTKTVDGEVVEDLHSKTTKDTKPREADHSSDLVGPE